MVHRDKPSITGRNLLRNAVWNFGGMAAPMLVGVVTIPLLIDGLGKERFGLLSIIWMGVGYFSLFDLGLSRALSKLVAERLGTDRSDDLGRLIWTALFLIVVLGVAGGIIVGVGSETLVHRILKVDALLRSEAVAAFRVLALGLPAVIATTALIGLLEAHQRFARITAVRIPLGVVTFAGPLVSLQFSDSLVWATAALLCARVAALAAYFASAASIIPELRRPVPPRTSFIGPLSRFGSWLTVTNIVGPLLNYFDRFFIGSLMGMMSVAYYVTPYEVISRLQILPKAAMGVLFPALTMSLASDRSRIAGLYGRVSRVLFLIMLPVSGACFLFAPEALQLWLGEDFRMAATPIVKWLAMGAIINTLARPPFTALQSTGRPDLVARTHLAELLPYVAVLWFLTTRFGVAGTAAAWSLRIVADTVILNELVRGQIPELARIVARTRRLILAIIVGFLAAWPLDSLAMRGVLYLVVVGVAVRLLWPTINALLNGRPATGAPPGQPPRED